MVSWGDEIEDGVGEYMGEKGEGGSKVEGHRHEAWSAVAPTTCGDGVAVREKRGS